MPRSRYGTYENFKRSFDKNNVYASPQAQRKARAMEKLLEYLKATHHSQHVHVWLDGKTYLGLYTWGVAMHWRNGYSESRQEMSAISKQAAVLNLSEAFSA